MITELVVSFCKDGGGSVNVNVWFFFTERDDQFGYQHYSHELLMMGIVVPETC